MADARSLHAARDLRGALRVSVGESVSARPELLSRAPDLSQFRFRQALRALQLGRGRSVVRLLRWRYADVLAGPHVSAECTTQFAADLAYGGDYLLRAARSQISPDAGRRRGRIHPR